MELVVICVFASLFMTGSNVVFSCHALCLLMRVEYFVLQLVHQNTRLTIKTELLCTCTMNVEKARI